jgi:hypothetical protein
MRQNRLYLDGLFLISYLPLSTFWNFDFRRGEQAKVDRCYVGMKYRPYPSDGRGNDGNPFERVGFFIRRVWRWEDVEYGGAIQGMTAMGL